MNDWIAVKASIIENWVKQPTRLLNSAAKADPLPVFPLDFGEPICLLSLCALKSLESLLLESLLGPHLTVFSAQIYCF
jgi:hypothetical protein